MTTTPNAPAPDAGAIPQHVQKARARKLLRGAIEHYRRTLPEGTTFPTARRLFAERVLLRDDKTVRRWLAGLTPTDPRVLAYLEGKHRDVQRGALFYRSQLRKLTPRQLLWER